MSRHPQLTKEYFTDLMGESVEPRDVFLGFTVDQGRNVTSPPPAPGIIPTEEEENQPQPGGIPTEETQVTDLTIEAQNVREVLIEVMIDKG